MKEKIFAPGVRFESDTVYTGKEKEYHIYPDDCSQVVGHGFASPQEPVRTAFFLNGLKNVVIDLNGAKLIFHGRIAPFILSECSNIALKNFSVDYDRPYYTQAELVRREEGGILVRVSEGFPYSVKDGCFVAESEFWSQRLEGEHCLIQPYDAKTLSPAAGAGCILAAFNYCDSVNPPMPITLLRAEQEGEYVRFTGDFPPSWKEGHLLEIMHEKRDKNAILAERSRNIFVSGVRLIHCAAMGFVAMFCENVTLEAFDMYFDGSERGLITANADSVHCFHCTGSIRIKNCVFENMLDDAVNIHGNYTVTEKAEGDVLKVNVLAAALGHIRWYAPGDVINVYRGKTQEKRCTVRVVSARYDGYGVEIETQGGLSAEEGDVVENAAVPEIYIENCITGRNRPRGFLLSSGGKTVVRNCVFSNCDCGIHFTGDTSYWYESGPVRDVTVENCLFDRCGYCGQPYAVVFSPDFRVTEKAPYYHKNVKIVNNTFRSFTGAMLKAYATDGIVFKHNRLIKSNDYPAAPLPPVELTGCGKAEIEI